jgi:hypothetical protein
VYIFGDTVTSSLCESSSSESLYGSTSVELKVANVRSSRTCCRQLNAGPLDNSQVGLLIAGWDIIVYRSTKYCKLVARL